MPFSAQQLRVSIANEPEERLAVIAPIVAGLGHEVVDDAAGCDVALVGCGEDAGQALELIDRIVEETASLVIALVGGPTDGFLAEAAKHGVFGFVVDDDPETFRNTMQIALQRVAEHRSLRGSRQLPRVDEHPHLAGLTGAELRLLPLLAQHRPFREIAGELSLPHSTIKTQAVSVYRKLGLSSA